MRDINNLHLIEIGRFGKTHGVAGELNAVVDFEHLRLADLHCIFLEIDSIPVPFFIDSVRPKGEAILIKLSGIDSIEEARPMVNLPILADEDEVRALIPEEFAAPDPDADGFYASDFIGFAAFETDGTQLGTVKDIDDATANVLFIIDRPDTDRPLLVPVADEFIADMDMSRRTITFDIPEEFKNL